VNCRSKTPDWQEVISGFVHNNMKKAKTRSSALATVSRKDVFWAIPRKCYGAVKSVFILDASRLMRNIKSGVLAIRHFKKKTKHRFERGMNKNGIGRYLSGGVEISDED
jgi:hypothetical protein